MNDILLLLLAFTIMFVVSLLTLYVLVKLILPSSNTNEDEQIYHRIPFKKYMARIEKH
jgi:hypothetical protein